MKKDNSVELLNEIWEWKDKHINIDMSILDIIVDFSEYHNYDIVEVGEILAVNKNFKNILENDLKKLNIISSDKTKDTLSEWE